jgi:hypothetical protein
MKQYNPNFLYEEKTLVKIIIYLLFIVNSIGFHSSNLKVPYLSLKKQKAPYGRSPVAIFFKKISYNHLIQNIPCPLPHKTPPAGQFEF